MDATDEIVEADRAAVQAAAEVEALAERVRDGDEQVTPEHIERARGLARFAELRRDAARRRAERKRVDARRGEAQRLLDELADTSPGSVRASQVTVAEALAAARDAVERLVATVEAHRGLVEDAAARLGGLRDVLPDGVSASGIRPVTVAVGGWSAHGVDVLDAVLAAISPTLEAHNVQTATPNGRLVERYYAHNISEGFTP